MCLYTTGAALFGRPADNDIRLAFALVLYCEFYANYRRRKIGVKRFLQFVNRGSYCIALGICKSYF